MDIHWDKIRQKLKKELDADRYEHTLGVAETAERMARIFGEDAEKARLAGLLHDCAKCMTLDEMKRAAAGLPEDPELNTRALMHAPAGMCLARDKYGVTDPDVLGAIRWHTTGKKGMTALEKIIYLADVIEPNRKSFDGIEELRKLSLRDLDQAMALALRLSVGHVLSRGKPVHPDSLEALRQYEKTED